MPNGETGGTSNEVPESWEDVPPEEKGRGIKYPTTRPGSWAWLVLNGGRGVRTRFDTTRIRDNMITEEHGDKSAEDFRVRLNLARRKGLTAQVALSLTTWFLFALDYHGVLDFLCSADRRHCVDPAPRNLQQRIRNAVNLYRRCLQARILFCVVCHMGPRRGHQAELFDFLNGLADALHLPILELVGSDGSTGTTGGVPILDPTRTRGHVTRAQVVRDRPSILVCATITEAPATITWRSVTRLSAEESLDTRDRNVLTAEGKRRFLKEWEFDGIADDKEDNNTAAMLQGVLAVQLWRPGLSYGPQFSVGSAYTRACLDLFPDVFYEERRDKVTPLGFHPTVFDLPELGDFLVAQACTLKLEAKMAVVRSAANTDAFHLGHGPEENVAQVQHATRANLDRLWHWAGGPRTWEIASAEGVATKDLPPPDGRRLYAPGEVLL